MAKFRSVVLSPLVASLVILVTSPLYSQDPQDQAIAVPEAERVLPVEPETVSELFESALFTVRLARPGLAKAYLGKLLQKNPSEEDLLALREEHGLSAFLSLTSVRELNPEASDLLERVIAAVQSKVNDPAYAQKLLAQLGGSARERDQALIELRNLGPYSVPPILRALTDPTADRNLLISTMARLGNSAIDPLIGALQSPSAEIRGAAAEVLGVVGGEEELIWLYHSAFDEAESAGVQLAARRAMARIRYDDPQKTYRINDYGTTSELIETAVMLLSNQYQWPVRYEDMTMIPVWTWDQATGTVKESVVTRRNAAIHFAERFARQAAELAPLNREAPIVLLAAKMLRDIEQAGWDQPVPTGPGTAHDLAVLAGPDVCLRVLAFGIEHGIAGAALTSTMALGLNGSRSILNSANGSSAIIQALNSAHPRVQFAAAVTILQWEPNQAFRSSSRVVEILGRAIQADNTPAGVVIDPNIQRGASTATLLRELGYDASLATTGIEGFRIASERADVEIGVLHPNTIRWDLTQTLENLRADSRTRLLPLVVYGPASVRDRFTLIQKQFEHVVYINEGSDALDLHRELQPVLAQLSPPPMTNDQRARQRRDAAFWLRRIATSSQSNIFDLALLEEAISSATNTNDIASDAIIALGGIGRPSVQQRFVEIIEAPALDVDLRTQAAYQLAFHIQRFGNLLNSEAISSIQNVAENSDVAALQTAISSVIGSLKPTEDGARTLILSAPAPELPIVNGDQT